MKQERVVVLIVGAGPAGLATSACLNRLRIPNIVLEREECSASLWKRGSYDRLKLHLAKQFCQLPYMSFPPNTPTFVPKQRFITYLDQYVTRFDINPRYGRNVTAARYDRESGGWVVEAEKATKTKEVYMAQFLVVATGENSEGIIPEVSGLFESFEGDYMHSSYYKNGMKFAGKDVLVVGCGNSGMEIAYDLSNWKARVSIVVRSPVHVLSRGIVRMGMMMLKYCLPVKLVDGVCVNVLAKLRMGSTSKYGLIRPSEGPFYLKARTGRSPTIDVGCLNHIKTGIIKVVPSIKRIEGKKVEFEDGKIKLIDSIIFATGYRSTVTEWLQITDGDLFNENGMPKRDFPNHWKGKNGLYCIGFARQGLAGISRDAQNITTDIESLMTNKIIDYYSCLINHLNKVRI